jgi:hypothetical protein
MSHHDFAVGALALALAIGSVATTPRVASAQSQGGDQPVAVPYSAPVDQRPLPAPQPNYAPPQNPAASYSPPAYSPPPAPPASASSGDDARYAARDQRQDYAPQANYTAQDDGRYTDRYYRDNRADYAPPAPQQTCQMVEQLSVFPDDTVQRTSARACRDARGRWRLVD